MSALSNPLYVKGKYTNVAFPRPFDIRDNAVSESAGIVSVENEPYNLAIRVARSQQDFDNRRSVHQEVLGSCSGAAKLRQRLAEDGAILKASANHIPQGPMCDGVAPRAHPEDVDAFEGVTMDSYGVIKGQQPHFRTIIPRQYGGEAGDATEHLSIPNRVAEIRSTDYLAGRNIGLLMHGSFLRDGMQDERMCAQYGYFCGAKQEK